MQLISQREWLKMHLYFTTVKLYTVRIVWSTSGKSDRHTEFWLVLVADVTKVKMCDTTNN
jgi:hypothetical protein